MPFTSAVARSTALLVLPEPTRLEAVRVSEIWASVRPVIALRLPVVTKVPVASGSVQVRAAVRSALVIVPTNVAAPVVATLMTMSSVLAVALSTVMPRIVAPPLKVEAVVVTAPRAVTVARVSASAPRPQVPHVGFVPLLMRQVPLAPMVSLARLVVVLA